MQNIAFCDPSMDVEEKTLIDEFFDIEGPEIALLTEQISLALVEHNAECLRGIAALLGTTLVTPAVIAPLALASVETSSLLKYINQTDGVERSIRSVRSITERVNSPQDLMFLPQLGATLDEAEVLIQQKTGDVTPTLPNHEALIQEVMPDLVRESFYQTQSDYTRQHAWSGFKQLLFRQGSAEQLEVSSIDAIFDTLTAADSALQQLTPFRASEQTAEYVEKFNGLRDLRENIRMLWLTWMDEHDTGPIA